MRVCPVCQWPFATERELNTHIEIKHPKPNGTVIEVGKIYRTNLSKPGGLVKVLSIEPSGYNDGRMAAYIEHVEDHPYGYAKGTRGWYMVEDLVEDKE